MQLQVTRQILWGSHNAAVKANHKAFIDALKSKPEGKKMVNFQITCQVFHAVMGEVRKSCFHIRMA